MSDYAPTSPGVNKTGMIRDEEIRDPGLKRSYVAKYYERDKTHPLNSLYDAMDQDFKGLKVDKERSKTDTFWSCVPKIFMFLSKLIANPQTEANC
jgi:hypothetical protein